MWIVLAVSGLENFFQLLIAIIAFAIVLFLTYFTTKFIGNYQKTNSTGTNFEMIETYRISNTKYLQILRIGKKYVVIAVCKDTITSISELSEEDVTIPDYTGSQESFAKILDKLKKIHPKDSHSLDNKKILDKLKKIYPKDSHSLDNKEKDKEDNGNDDSNKI